eukprot:gene36950-48215_t
MDRENVDTDAIIPKQFLKSIRKTGFGPNLFDEWRYLDHGEPGQDPATRKPNPDFVLNQPRYAGASILLARKNFGCGSSREHAPWALDQYGFRAILAPSFADIFFNNSFKNGLLPIVLPEATVDALFNEALAFPGFTLTVDLERQVIVRPQGEEIPFEVQAFRKFCLLNGLDDIGLTLRHAALWTHWQAQWGGAWSRTRDDNGSAERQDTSFSPTVSVSWLPAPAWRLQFTRSAGATARQFASITSATPALIAPPGRSTENELGVHWSKDGWTAGAGVFELARPYRYERETVSVWRGRQTHRGLEAALGWANEADSARLVFTAQALRARVNRTGDITLDGLQPPGVPQRRASLLAELPVPLAPAWSVSLLGEAVSRRATLDDNRVFAAGYA